MSKREQKWFNMNVIKTSFSAGIGISLASMLFTLFGILFFIYGWKLYKQGDSFFGIICMIIGMTFLGGYGLGPFLDTVEF